MKTLLFLIASTCFSLSVLAGGGPSTPNKHQNKYCAKMVNNKLTVVHQGNALTSTVTLGDGSRVQSDGTVTRKDGSSVMLHQGECIDSDGKIMMEEPKKKTSTNNNKTY